VAAAPAGHAPERLLHLPEVQDPLHLGLVDGVDEPGPGEDVGAAPEP